MIRRRANSRDSLLKEGGIATKGLNVRIGQGRINKPFLGDELHGFNTAHTGDPHGRVRGLHGPWPSVDVLERKMFSLPGERTWVGPGLENKFGGFAEAFSGMGRVLAV